MQLNIKKNIEYFLIMQIILLSGTLYFNATILMYMLGVTSIFYLLISRFYFSRSNIYVLLTVLTLIGVQYFVTYQNGVNFKDLFLIVMIITFLFFIQSNMRIERFAEIYINIILAISIISLCCFILINFFNFNNFPLKKNLPVGISNYVITPYYNLGIENYSTTDGYTIENELGFKRNSGIFWEPGAYQAFLNIGLLILCMTYVKNNYLQKVDKIPKKLLIKIIILALTLLTTQSTTGYIIGFIIFLYTFITTNKNLFSRKILLRFCLFLFIISLIAIFSPIKEVVIYKLFHQGGSYSTRLNDNLTSFKIFFEKPLWGYGYFSKLYNLREGEYGLYHNSSGIGLLFSMFGIVFSSVYLILLFRGLKHFFKSVFIITFLIFCMFVSFHTTEWFIFRPVFLLFLFKFKSSKKLLPY